VGVNKLHKRAKTLRKPFEIILDTQEVEVPVDETQLARACNLRLFVESSVAYPSTCGDCPSLRALYDFYQTDVAIIFDIFRLTIPKQSFGLIGDLYL
jgi:hypothetical protein